MKEKPRRNVYRYRLINHYRQIGAKLEWIRIWIKQSVKNYKYKYHPIVLTISGKSGEFIEKKFANFTNLKIYLCRFETA